MHIRRAGTAHLASFTTYDRTVTLLAIITPGLLAMVIYLTTLQVIPNGSTQPYMTDVGEIQNALPRWGTLHFPGYPLYSMSGSLFVTILRVIGIQPAAGTALYSALWGAISVSLLSALALAYGVPALAASTTALVFGLAKSIWVDASIAEVHTMSMALLLATILAAVSFSRSGQKRDLLLTSFLAGQMLLHQRAFVMVGPALLLFVLLQRRAFFTNAMVAVAGAAAGALVYLYLPLRDWMGASWTFNAPGTWSGFWSLFLDTKTGRIIEMPQDFGDFTEQGLKVMEVMASELPLVLIVLGLVSLALVGRKRGWLEATALGLVALPYLVLALFIRGGQASDALLAFLLPIYAIAAFGLAVLTGALAEKSKWAGWALVMGWLGIAAYLFVEHRPAVLAITRDTSALEVIDTAEAAQEMVGGEPTLMALWGHDYWALAYAQAFQNTVSDFHLVDHNADLGQILSQEGRLLTLSDTFYQRPLSWWREVYGQIHLSAVSPGIVEVRAEPLPQTPDGGVGPFSLGNGVNVASARLHWHSAEELWLVVYWQAERAVSADYSVAVHLVAQDPPAGEHDILAQDDEQHPVEGWYPVSQWQAGETVRDVYSLATDGNLRPVAVRLSMYQVMEDGSFANTAWLSIPVPDYVN